jgi:hypothetical protein
VRPVYIPENSMTKSLLSAALIAVAALAAQPVFAHGGAAPKHGGVVRAASDISFELVPTADGAALYLEDHGKPMAPTGFSGKLTVLNGADKSEAPLTAAADKLEAKGVKLSKGAKAVATVTTAQKKEITVRFTMK